MGNHFKYEEKHKTLKIVIIVLMFFISLNETMSFILNDMQSKDKPKWISILINTILYFLFAHLFLISGLLIMKQLKQNYSEPYIKIKGKVLTLILSLYLSLIFIAFAT